MRLRFAAPRLFSIGLVALGFVGALSACGDNVDVGANHPDKLGAGGSSAGGSSAGASGSGSTPRQCGTRSSEACAADEFCDFSTARSCGATGGQGTCQKKPEACTQECALPGICGCDGKLHCSACQANQLGISVSPGVSACAEAPKGCSSNDACGPADYCDFSGAAACGANGTCRPRPEGCLTLCSTPQPSLCGCDGGLRCDACDATWQGISMAPDASFCPGVEGVECGSLVPIDCGSTRFCDRSGATSCDAPGVCRTKPTVCDASCASPLLCGCDGKTYCSACVANEAGTTIDPSGASCGSTGGEACGGPTAIACSAGKFCDTSGAASCSELGVCKDKPEACTEECADPLVCGCDGKGYCNACSANGAGTSIAIGMTGCAP